MEAFLFVVTVPKAEYEKELNALKSTETLLTEEKNVTIDIECEIPKSKNNLNQDAVIEKKNNESIKFSTPIGGNNKTSLVDASTKTGDDKKVVDNNIVKSEKVVKIEESLGKRGQDGVNGYKDLHKKACKSLKEYLQGLKKEGHAAEDSNPSLQNLDDNDCGGSTDELPLEKMVEQTLSNLDVPGAAWSSCSRGTHAQVAFSVQGGARCERVLHALRAAGVGAKNTSTLSVLPCALHYTTPLAALGVKSKPGKTEEMKDSAWSTFVRSVRSRMTVAQVSEQVRAGAALTFDFFFLLMVAALTAAIGLAENSTVFLVASMLISPLMGPIMAGTFGTVIQDRDLQRMGVVHEVIGLLVALAVGFVFGLVICGINENYGVGEWPTYEITSRCDVRSLWVGALVAVPSGAAVAIAMLAGNTPSLVGVAISASLLPPAVNAGLLWAMSLVHLIFQNDDTRFTTVVKTQVYSDNPVIELAADGSISLLLTVVNIICIFFAGILVFMIKEVAPSKFQGDQFWRTDLRTARNFNKNVTNDSQNPQTSPENDEISIDNTFEATLEQAIAWDLRISHAELLNRLKLGNNSHMTWSPAATISQRPSAHELHGRYRRLSEEPNYRRPRLSFQMNHPSNNYSRLNEECSVPSESSTTSSEVQPKPPVSKPKFIITPVIDPNYQRERKDSKEV